MASKNWHKIPLKKLCSRIGDGIHGTPNYVDNGDVYFINGNNLKNGRIEITKDTKTVTETELKSSFIPLNENSLLLSINGTLGSMAFFNNEKVMLGKSAAYLNFNSNINCFYYYYFQLKGIQNYFYDVATGSTIKNLSLKSIQDFEVPIPEEFEWKGIVKTLSSIDAKIELNNRINRELEAMAKTLYDYWFVQFDFPNEQGRPYKSSGGKMVYNAELKREIPEGWEVGTVEDYCRIFTGKKDVNQSLEIGKYKFFSCAPGYKYSDEKLYEGKAILVSGNGSYTGRTIFVDEGFDLYQRTYACVNKTETDYLAYIYYSMLRYMSLKINGGTHGSAIPYIVFDDIAKEIIVINHNLINKFQNIVYPLINKIMNNNKQAVELAKLRDWLLPMLMNGQVTVKEAEESLSMAAEPSVEYKKG